MTKAEDTKDRIVEVASRMIATQGLHQLTFDALAKAAGVTRQLVHKYFRDKEEIFHRCFARVREDFQKEATVAVLSEDDPVKRLKMYNQFAFKWIEDNELKASIFLLFFHYSVQSKKLRKLNSGYVEHGTKRIYFMLQALTPNKKKSAKLMSQAKLIQNLLMGSIVSVLTEEVDPRRIRDLTWEGMCRILEL